MLIDTGLESEGDGTSEVGRSCGANSGERGGRSRVPGTGGSGLYDLGRRGGWVVTGIVLCSRQCLNNYRQAGSVERGAHHCYDCYEVRIHKMEVELGCLLTKDDL